MAMVMTRTTTGGGDDVETAMSDDSVVVWVTPMGVKRAVLEDGWEGISEDTGIPR